MRPMIVCLGLLTGLSWSVSPAIAQVAPVPVSPSGLVDGQKQTYTWRATPGATWYLLFISDSITAPRLAEWYTATQAGCGEGTGICTVNVSLDFAEGQVAWWVRGYFATGEGPWSTGTTIYVRRTPGAWSFSLPEGLRFQLVFGGAAVLDRETGLVWQRTPSATTGSLSIASSTCINANTGGKRGWRIPSQAELASVAEDGLTPPLQSGHPFTLGASPMFWTQSPYGSSANNLVGWFGSSAFFFTQQPLTDPYRTWCVRAATGADR